MSETSLIGPNVLVSAGGKKTEEQIARATQMQLVCVLAGTHKIEIPLNGGSDTRRASRDYWRDWAEVMGLNFKCPGNCVVVITGPTRFLEDQS